MVVKFADTQKEKDQKRVHHVGSTNLWGGIGLNNLPPQYMTVIIPFNLIPFPLNFKFFLKKGSTIEWRRKSVAIERTQRFRCPTIIGSFVAKFAGQHSR